MYQLSRKKFRILCTLLFACMSNTALFAGVESVSTTLKGAQVSSAVNFFVEDFQYAKMNGGSPGGWGFANSTTEGWLSAGIDRSNLSYVSSSYDVDLIFSVVTWTYNYGTSAFVQNAPVTCTLQVTYDPLAAATEIERSTHLFSNAHKISATLSAVQNHTTHASVSVPANLLVEALVSVERYHDFSTSAVPTAPTIKAFDVDEDGLFKDELEIRWSYIQGAEEYDLEWTFVNDYNQNGSLGTVTNPALIPFSGFDFEHNCTRVRITDQSYRIPLLTDRGYLLYRIRGIGRGGPSAGDYSKNVYGKWSMDVSSYTNVSDFPQKYYNTSTYASVSDGHDKNKNWQVTTSFAENGKKKEVISYFDGSLRNRQTVTRVNSSDSTVLIGETIYDHQGRGAVQTLPAPTSTGSKASTVLKYYPYFNISKANTPEPFDRNDFDKDDGDCALTVNDMDSTAALYGGASAYYSSENALVFSHRDYIPTAKGFPFTMVEYEPDNTNRIRTQTGVGVDHAYGSGHETNYFYGQPEQEQLDRLFATEAGYSQHYKKNMVVDANGQVSVTYLDMQGRTIATSLAGDTASSSSVVLLALKDPISNNSLIAANSLSVTVDLLSKVDPEDYDTPFDNNVLSPDSTSLVYAAQKLVASEGDYDFSYSLKSVPFVAECGPPVTYPARYLVDIHVKDQCGTELLVSPLAQEDYSSTSALDPPLTHSGTAADLPVGAYTVEKVLNVDMDAAKGYAEQFIADATENNEGCLLTYEDFLEHNQSQMHTEGCDITCAECVTSLGARQDFIDNGGTGTEWDALYEECNAPCKRTSVCQLGYESMLRDVTPGGQYGATEGADFELSVFNINNKLPGNVHVSSDRNWTEPTTDYVDELGQASLIEVHYIGGSTSSPYSYDPVVNHPGLLTSTGGKLYTKPEDLADLSVFLDKWEDSWARSLVQYHPEYKYFEWCDPLADPTASICYSNDEFDYVLTAVSSYTMANAPLTISTGTCTTQATLTDLKTASNVVTLDPFFATSGFGGVTDPCSGNTYAQLMQAQINSYGTTGMGMAAFAAFTANCGTWYGNNAAASCPGYSNGFGATTATRDQEWNLFKSFYLSEKQKLMQMAADQFIVNSYTAAPTGEFNYCGCVGEQSFNPYLACPFVPEYFTGPFVSPPYPVAFYDVTRPQPCSYGAYHLYKDKARRFGFADLMPVPPSSVAEITDLQHNADYQLYQQTGLCPMALDLKGWLNDMAMRGILSPGTPSLYQVQGFTPRLYKALSGLTAATNAYTQYTWTPSGTGTTLSISLSPTPVAACSTGAVITLVLPASSSLTWAGYNSSSWKINSFTDISPVSSTTFKIKAEVDHDNDPGTAPIYVVLSGTTCLDLTGCSSSFTETDCVPSEEMKDLQDLMNLLSVNSALENTSGEDITVAPYSTVFNRTLAGHLALNCATTWVWKKLSSTHYQIVGATGCALGHDLYTFDITFSSAVADGDFFSGCNVNPDYPTDPDNFEINNSTAGPQQGLFQLIRQVDYSPFYYYTSMSGDCSYPNNCKTREHAFRGDLEKLLNGFVTGVAPTTGGTPLTGTPWFSAGMQNFLSAAGTETFEAYNTITSSTFNVPIGIEEEERVKVFCSVELYPPNSTQAVPDYTDITSFYDLQADESKLVNGKAYEFTVKATLSTTTVAITLRGTSCFPLRNCKDCPPPSPNQLLDCTEAYTEYKNTLDELGIDALDETPDPAFVFGLTAFCDYATCWQDYTDYLAAVECTTSMQNTYVSLQQFCLGGWARCKEDYHTYYNSVKDILDSYPALFVGLKDFCQQGIAEPCVSTYTTYVDGLGETEGAGPHNVADFCSGFPLSANCEPYPPFVPIYTVTPTDPCEGFQNAIAISHAHYQYNQYVQSVKDNFLKGYIRHCMTNAVETFSMDYTDKEYHFTLYYYDQAGNLVRTIPPAGVSPRDLTAVYSGTVTVGQQIKSDRQAGVRNVYTHHTFPTTYTYNSLNQLIAQNTPDAGTSEFLYDELGRLVASQNAKQAAASPTYQYSYTLYDALGRTNEVGQIGSSVPMQTDAVNFPVIIAAGTRSEVTKTFYDETFGSISGDNLRNRVSAMTYQEAYDSDPDVYDYGVGYSYDVHGNVKKLTTDNQELYNLLVTTSSSTLYPQRYKNTTYNYDLISGNVNDVHYQEGESDAFHHRYEYDADNRITNVYTSTTPLSLWRGAGDEVLYSPTTSGAGGGWDQDAKYFYYPHGPLKRSETGHDKVQGTDYAYTIQGWMKGVNSNSLKAARDIGKDADPVGGNLNRYIGSDEYGYSLGYFAGDYTAIGQGTGGPLTSNADMFLLKQGPSSDLNTASPGLYNGNIRNMTTSINYFMQGGDPPQAYAYHYDQLNRIKQMKMFDNADLGTDNEWNNTSLNNAGYFEFYKYDHNGNILKLKRNGDGSNLMDNLTYNYYAPSASGGVYDPNTDPIPYDATNKLAYIGDAVSSTYSVDIDNQSSGNYTYDEIGNLKGDDQEEIQTIDWTVYGKIKTVTRKSGSDRYDLEFKYDPLGNRICKIVKPRSGGSPGSAGAWEYTYYTRDAQGNTLSTYELAAATTSPAMNLKEQYIYGSSRTGIMNRSMNVTTAAGTTDFSTERGYKNYELSNHLGNVLVVVSDRKLPHNSSGTIDYYTADLLSANDYASFGSPMPGRSFNTTDYRYGFNGKENDREVIGTGSGTQDYGMRIYNPSLGRFLSVDPLTKSYPMLTPYQFASNTPIQATDLDGEEANIVVHTVGKDFEPAITTVSYNEVYPDKENGPLGTGDLHLFGTTDEGGNLSLVPDLNLYAPSLRDNIEDAAAAVGDVIDGALSPLTNGVGVFGGESSDRSIARKGDPSHFVELSDIELIAKAVAKNTTREPSNDPSKASPTTIMEKAKKVYDAGAKDETGMMKNKGGDMSQPAEDDSVHQCSDCNQFYKGGNMVPLNNQGKPDTSGEKISKVKTSFEKNHK